MKGRQRWLALGVMAAILIVLAWWVFRPAGSDYRTFSGEVFATDYRVTFRGDADLLKVQRVVEAELERIDGMASTWKPDSELMQYNRSERAEGIELSPDLAGLLVQAYNIERQTGGAFSPRPDGGLIDLSGIAKGYAVDRVVELLQDVFGITSCMVDIGGEVKVLGDGPSGAAWNVGLYVPSAVTDTGSYTLQLRDCSIATSGAYFKGNHILDPQTGEPVTNDLLSVSIIHPSNTTADALATALYVMGPDRGLAWAEEHAIRVIFLFKDGTRSEYDPGVAMP